MSSQYAGYTGKVLMVDLSTETVREYPWTDRDRKLYLGGKVMAYKILCDHLTGKEKAFSEENWIVISTGPLTLSGAPSSVRYDISAISPATGLPTSSNCGGDFGIYLKRAGYDALILAGRCQEHRWLEIRSDACIFHEAQDLWGTLCEDCRQLLDQKIQEEKYGRLYIGPAGENCVRYASILDGTHTSGRSGIGAVLGWKNLKAVTVSGNLPLPVHDPQRSTQYKKEWFQELYAHPYTGPNSRSGKPTSKACPGCPILCRRQFNKGADSQTDLFNQLGMDSVSAQDTVAWAVYAAQQGVLTQPLPEEEKLFADIAHRRGIGDDLAEGIKYLSKKYDCLLPKKSKSAADKHNRNDGYPALLAGWGLDPETMSPGEKLDCAILYMDLCEAVSASGLCMFTVNAFCPAFLIHQPDCAKARLVHNLIPKSGWLIHAIVRSPKLLFLPLSLFRQIKLLYSVSGLNLTPGQFLEVGSRSFLLEQMLVHRFGGDTGKLPKMLAKTPDDTTGARYFAVRNWDNNGIPTATAKKRLHISSGE